MKTFSEFIAEANRKAQKASKAGRKPKEGAVPQFVMDRMAQGMKSMTRKDKKELRANYKELHKSERFTKPAMKRSGAIR